MNASPLPAAALPAAAPNAANAAATAPGVDAQQPAAGGFARLLDQARDDPGGTVATDQDDALADKPAAARNLRGGLARSTATPPKTLRPAAPDASAMQAGDARQAADPAADAVKPFATDPVAEPPQRSTATDTAALIANLAAFAQHPAPESSAGPASQAWDQQNRAANDKTASPSGPGLTRPAPGAAAATAAAAPGLHAAADAQTPARASAASAPESPTVGEAAKRGFAAELQAALPTTPAPAPAPSVAPNTGLAAATAATVDAAPAADSQIAASPHSAGFAPELGAKLATFVREGVLHARLELHPAQMGPLTVQIQLEGLAAQVHLAAEHADTRQALEQAMPQLASSLREAGLTLSGGGVFEQPRQPHPEAQPGAGRGSPRTDDKTNDQTQPAAAQTRRRGVVDLVA